jgi:hypothetical protein
MMKKMMKRMMKVNTRQHLLPTSVLEVVKKEKGKLLERENQFEEEKVGEGKVEEGNN